MTLKGLEEFQIHKLLSAFLPEERIRMKYIDRVSYGADAGFYFLLPLAVVKPVTEEEIIKLFTLSHTHSIPLVFRTGGTSLSGQSITDGILIDLSQYWNKIAVEDNGALVRVQPGITGAMVNTWLLKYRRKIGPDPASISAAMMGGILSNNSSGMCCGVALNAYHTTKYIRFILPDGKIFNTENWDDYKRFEKECPGIFMELLSIRLEIISNPELQERIRKQYTTKNTVGYSLNAFIDHKHPLEILAKLLVGAEGTLAFIAEAVMQTVPDYAFKSTALLYFPNIYSACEAIVPLKAAGVEAVELMDRASLRSVELMTGIPAEVRTLPPSAAALLVEFQDNSHELLTSKVNRFLANAPALSLLSAPVFTMDADERAFLWKVRKGLFPAIGAVRMSGTTVILEDIAFSIEKLADAVIDLQQLFTQFGYKEAIIFGHAKDGNIHFVITQSFNDPAEVDRYDRFMRSLVELVVNKYDGALKAEHGTGRNMAPFVETQWGGDAYNIMKRLKQCIDPYNLLNPGVIINNDHAAHIKNLKSMPTVEEEVDKCIECGYCEHKCPSRDITTTPRRRIVIRRELERLRESGDLAKHRLLLDQYQYDGLDTCAVDGLCATACPVDINTGDLVKRLRKENHSVNANARAMFVARNFKAVERIVKLGLQAGYVLNRIFGKNAMTRFTKGMRRVVPGFPLWLPAIAPAPRALKLKPYVSSGSETEQVVYFSSCISRVMGRGVEGKKSIMETFVSIAQKVGVAVVLPLKTSGTCCGQIFSSKGFAEAYQYTANETVDLLWNTSIEGTLTVVTDVSSCAYTLQNIRSVLSDDNKKKYDKLKIIDAVEYLHDHVLPKTGVIEKKGSVILHPVCSLDKMGITSKFISIARFFASDVHVPLNAGCCGMAGDRGFLFPELTRSATNPEATEAKSSTYDGYYSSTKTCEIALTQAVQKNYESILYLADERIPINQNLNF